MLHISVEREGQPRKELRFAKDVIVIGREADHDLQLAFEDGASRQHCRSALERGRHFVEDLGSRNGTKVNGKRIAGRTVVSGLDVIEVGKVTRAGLDRIGFGAVDCQGTYFISADFRPLLTRGPLRGFNGDDVELCKKLTVEAGVTAIPVSAFYQNDAPRHFIRFSFCKKDETIDSAVERLGRYFA